MKQFLIKYQFTSGSSEDWHREINRFIAGIDADPQLAGKVGYRCMKNKNGSDYYHLATVVDDHARSALQAKDFFSHYTAKTKSISGGTVEVIPLELIAATGTTPSDA